MNTSRMRAQYPQSLDKALMEKDMRQLLKHRIGVRDLGISRAYTGSSGRSAGRGRQPQKIKKAELHCPRDGP